MSKAFDSYMGGSTNTATQDANEFVAPLPHGWKLYHRAENDHWTMVSQSGATESFTAKNMADALIKARELFQRGDDAMKYAKTWMNSRIALLKGKAKDDPKFATHIKQTWNAAKRKPEYQALANTPEYKELERLAAADATDAPINKAVDGCEAEDADIAVGSKVQIVGGSFAGCHGVVKAVNGDVVRVDVGHGAEYSFRTAQVRAYDAAEGFASMFASASKPKHKVGETVEITSARLGKKGVVGKIEKVDTNSSAVQYAVRGGGAFNWYTDGEIKSASDSAEATDAAEPLVSDADVVSYAAAATRALISEVRNLDAAGGNAFKAAFNLSNLAGRMNHAKAKEIREWANKVQDAVMKGLNGVMALMRSRPF